MKIAFKRTFARDLRKIPTKQRETIEKFVFDSALKAESLDDLAPIVALSGHSGYFRKRFGDYRVGFQFSEGRLIFYRVLHRKDIYRRFP